MTVEAGKTPRKDPGSKPKRTLKTPEYGVVLLTVLSLIVLFNPFSEEVLAVAPALPFLAAFALFMVPGLVLSLALLSGPDFTGPARVPVAFVLSVGVFGLVALPRLILDKTFAPYPINCGIVLALFLWFAVVRIRRRDTSAEEGERYSATALSTTLLWIPFSLLAGTLAWISAANTPRPGDDIWIYLSHVRNLSETGKFTGGSSRLALSGWLPEQSVLSLISGLDPVALVLRYLAPTLVVISLLALYTLARALLKNEKAALVISSFSALFFLVAFGSLSFDSVLAPGGEFVNYIAEDKFVARYVFLPVALSLAILFLRDRSRRNLGLFFFVCLSVGFVHPLGLIFIGVSIAGFGLVHLAFNRRDRGAWWGVGGLWLVLLVITGPPALYLLATGDPMLYRLDATHPDVANNLIENWQYEQRLLQIGEGSYVVHPSLLLDPAMLVAYLLGVPFLIWKARQARDGLAAQLLLGVLVFVPVLTFIPYVATPISNVIGPWMLYRLTWPLLLAALLVLGWLCWEALRYVGSALEGVASLRRVAPFLPLIIVGLLLAEAIPLALTGLRAAKDPGEFAQDESTCLDPTFRWMQEAIPASGSVIMAPRTDNPCIAAYAASAKVVGLRGQISPQADQDLQNFYAAPTLGPETLEILERRNVGYVFLPANSPLNAQLEHLPGFARMNNPGERYRVYEVTDQQSAFEPTPAVVANRDLNGGEWDAAIEAYTEGLGSGSDDDRFLAYLGLGQAYVEKKQYEEATENYQAATELDPESSAAHEQLANAYSAAGENDRSRTEFERATQLDPENATLRLRYGRFLVPIDRPEAVEQHRAVVETFPKVPEYRVKLGAVLLLAGDPEAAGREFESAVHLAPLSAKIWADIGGANLASGRPQNAIGYYEKALNLEPNSQLYTLNLGRVHAQLSTLNGRNEERFEEAEALLGRVEELGHPPWEADQREAARIALGDLYLQWDRPEDAAAAYREALKLNPDSAEAKEKLAR